MTINSINGKDFKLGDTYAVVTNNFSAAGGDTYYAFKAATAKFDTGVPLDEAVMEYVTKELKGVIGEQYAAPQGRILMNPFKDVKVSSWFGQYVIDLYNDGIINGTSATTYAPNDTLTWAAALKLLLVSNGNLKAADATGADWSKNAIAKGIKAGDLVKNVCTICGGKGGGKPDSAMGGGKDMLKLDDALASVDDYVAVKLGL